MLGQIKFNSRQRSTLWKSIIYYRLKSLNTNKTTTNDVGNPGPYLEQTHKCGSVKPIKDVNIIPSW
jgi:hypothetical protein